MREYLSYSILRHIIPQLTESSMAQNPETDYRWMRIWCMIKMDHWTAKWVGKPDLVIWRKRNNKALPPKLISNGTDI